MTTDDRLVSGASSESSLPPNKSSGDIGELKPCPFCQSEGQTLLRGFRYADECPDRKELAVMCPTCEARAPLKAWNTRTPDPESAVAAAWEEAARVAKDRWREWRSSYEDDLDGMDACEDISKAISARASAIRAAHMGTASKTKKPRHPEG